MSSVVNVRLSAPFYAFRVLSNEACGSQDNDLLADLNFLLLLLLVFVVCQSGRLSLSTFSVSSAFHSSNLTFFLSDTPGS